jgi:hypothetical protein
MFTFEFAPTYFYTIQEGKWKQTDINTINLSWHWITLYNDDLTIKGIGMYEKLNIT